MSEQNAAAIEAVHKALKDHAADEKLVWTSVQAQVADLHGAWFGDPKQPDRKGYAEQIRDIQDYLGGVHKLTWLAVGGFISGVFALIVALVKQATVGG